MKRMLWTLTVAFLVAAAPALGLEPIVAHLDDNDPATEGFSADGPGWTVVGAIDDGGAPAWSYTQPGIVGEERQYRHDIDAAEQALRNLMLGGRCGMQLPYDSDAGTDLFDFKFVSALPLADILAPLSHVDLIDMDIQGAEDTVLPPAMEMLDRRD